MRRIAIAITLALAAAAVPALAQPDGNQITINATPPNVPFGSSVTISGRLTGPGSANERVDLQANPAGGSNSFDEVATTMTNAQGDYSFTQAPQVNTTYRVRARTSPPTTSGELLVGVIPRISLGVTDRTPRPGQVVSFYGAVRPEHDGMRVHIQRFTPGGYVTVKTVALKDSPDPRSVYIKNVRMGSSDARFRAILPAHEDHKTAKSRRLILRIDD